MSSNINGSIRIKRHAVINDYEILNESLGFGVSGKVLKCIRKSDEKMFAVKILRDTIKSRREIELHSKAVIGSDYIVGLEDVYENMYGKEKCLLMIMECMCGGELFNRIQSRGDNPFTEREAAQIVHSIGSAIHHLHSLNIAHRDLKPENLLYTSDDADAKLKLADFGFAKEVSMEKPLQTPCYTPYYVAPEVLSRQNYNKSCDLWSIGVITYILLCGYPPFYSYHGATISPGMKKRIRSGEYTFPSSEWKHISRDAIDVVRNLLKLKPEERMTIDELMNCSWIAQFTNVPPNPLSTVTMFNEEGNLAEIQAEIKDALFSMRPDSEDIVIRTLHSSSSSKNKILSKRLSKANEQKKITAEQDGD